MRNSKGQFLPGHSGYIVANPKNKTILLRVTQDFKDRVSEKAQAHGISSSAYITKAVEKALANENMPENS